MPKKLKAVGRGDGTADGADEPQTLGRYLSHVRTIKKLTLRQVEEGTGKEVSNAYLSQLETGKIAQPSPNVLHALARFFSVPFDTLMEKAGYIAAPRGGAEALRSGSGISRSRAEGTLGGEKLSQTEQEKLLEYLAFLRSRKNGENKS